MNTYIAYKKKKPVTTIKLVNLYKKEEVVIYKRPEKETLAPS